MPNFLSNKLLWVVIVTIMLLVLIGYSSQENNKVTGISNTITYTISPIQRLFLYSSQKVGGFFYYFKDMDKIKKENETLKDKIDLLEDENRKLSRYKEENNELREALNLKDIYGDYAPEAANIISKDMGNWFNMFRTDKGTKNGIVKNFPVRTSKGLVGRIHESDFSSSKVMTIVDPNSTISAKISKSGTLVLVKGDISLKEKGLCLMESNDMDSDVSVGDLIETSGLGGIYPKGIIIGEVTQTRKSSNNYSKYAIIKPVVDFKHLEQVTILKMKNQK